METIRCRVKWNLWWVVAVGCLEDGFMVACPFLMAQEQPPSTPSLWPFFLIGGIGAAFFSSITLYLARSLLFEEVTADEDGVRWRGAFGAWKSARWGEISDFYLSGATPTIEAPSGKFTLNSSFANQTKMMAFIAERAVNAPAREWEQERYRAAQDFTKRFDYWTKSQQWTAPLFSAYLASSLIALAWLRIADSKSHTVAAPLAFDRSWALFWMPLLLGILVFGSLAVMFASMIWMAWRDRRFAFERRHEHLEVSPRGLAWHLAEKRIEARWDEVRAIRALPGGFWGRHDYRVETQNGDFVVGHGLERISVWLQLVRQFAPHVAPQPIESRRDLGGESSTWSGIEVGKGARVFHFRTSETSFVLWMATIFSPALWLILASLALTPNSGDDPTPMPWLNWLLTLFCIVLTLFYAWLCFARAALWVDETGLVWRLPLFKTRRVTWSEIEKFGHDEHGYFLIANGKRRRFFLVTPVRKEALLQLVASRAVNATGRFS